MKKLGKLTLKEMEQEIAVMGSDSQECICAGSNWLNYARSQIGVTEIPGINDNPCIVEYLQTTTYPQEQISDEVNWCSAFVNWCVEQSGNVGTYSAAANSWGYWGYDVGNSPTSGDIGIRSDGRHVVIVDYVDGNDVHIIEGNSINGDVQESVVNVNDFCWRRSNNF